MKWLIVALLVIAGCGDAVLDTCDQANMPGPPAENAYRSISGDTLTWTWVVGCFQISEIWKFDGCHWDFDKLVKTRIDI